MMVDTLFFQENKKNEDLEESKEYWLCKIKNNIDQNTNSEVWRDVLKQHIILTLHFLLPVLFFLVIFIRACTSLNWLNRWADSEVNRPISGRDKVAVLHSLPLCFTISLSRRSLREDYPPMGQRIPLAPAAATILANKLPYESSESRSARYRSPSFLLRFSLDISRIMKSRESSTTESLRLSFPSNPSSLSRLPPPRHSSRSYCLASAFGIMHNSMARGLRFDAVTLLSVADRPRRWCRWFAIRRREREGGRRRRRRTVFYFVRAPRRVAALPFRIYRIRSRTNYRVPVDDPPPKGEIVRERSFREKSSATIDRSQFCATSSSFPSLSSHSFYDNFFSFYRCRRRVKFAG